MRNYMICATAMFVAIAVAPLRAAVIHVPADQPTIQAGINAASNGDVVLVSPGTYIGGITCSKAITLMSESGPELTHLQHNADIIYLNSIRPDSFHLVGFELSTTGPRCIASDFSNFVVVDCQFTGATKAAIHFSGYSCVIRNCTFTDPASAHSDVSCIKSDNLGRTRLERNIFYGLHYPYVFFTTSERVDLLNNTVVACDGGFDVSNPYGSPGVVYNNIFSSIAGTAVASHPSVGPVIDYNLYFNNGNDVTGGLPGPHAVFGDPMLANPAVGDFVPLPGSPVVDAGHPSPDYFDLDGTISDIGAIPLSSLLPRASQLRLAGEERLHVVSHTPTVIWSYINETAPQAEFELQVGTDDSWDVIEMWDTGIQPSADSSVVYAGAPLIDGQIYFVRVRVSNGIEWGFWWTASFRMNTTPTPPVPVSPIGGIEVHQENVVLITNNSTDAELDSRHYFFEIYSDEFLTQLAATRSDIAEQIPQTFTDIIHGLITGPNFWWRVRSSDGFEYSDWSQTESFVTTPPSVRHVPAEYATIQGAINVCGPGDTVLVSPGTYFENITFAGKNIHVAGEGGPDGVIIRPAAANQPLVTMGTTLDSTGQFRDFTVIGGSGSAALIVSGGSPTIRNNVIRDYSGSVDNPVAIRVLSGTPHIHRNLFTNNGGISCIGIFGGNPRIINNTFYDNARGLFTLNGQGVILNNIVMSSAEYGLYGNFAVSDYNNVWGNNPDYIVGAAGDNSLSADPLFQNPAAGDFRVSEFSPCRDAGHPDPQYDDLDGSRNDIGAYPLLLQKPSPWLINYGPDDRMHVVSENPTIYWSFVDDVGVASGYEIEVSTDADWSVAEQWSTGQIISSDTSALYAGLPLTDGEVYFLRVRVFNGSTWGGWNISYFRMNTAPNPPTPLRPLGGIETIAQATELSILNGSDAQSDILTYDFEVYSDAGLVNLVVSNFDVASTPDSTFVTLPADLQPNADYWWRVRANDNWEYSPWSSTETFHARSSRVFTVPGDFASIGEAIEGAVQYDTILVYPGIYQVNLDLLSKPLRLLSAAGPSSTVLTQDAANLPIILAGSVLPGRTEISGFTFLVPADNPAINVASGSPTIRRNVFRDSPTPHGPPPIRVGSGNPLIERNLFRDNQAIAAVGIYGGSARIINNTFVNNLRGFFTLTTQGEALNNIVVSSVEYGIYGDFTLRDFNNVWSNNPDYATGVASSNDIAADPKFFDTAAGDFSLLPTSPCVDAGDPQVEYNDPDGSRNDIGAFPFLGPLPVALDVFLFGEDQFHVMADAPRFRWSYYDTLGIMSGFEVEVGTDGDWSVAEMWASGQVSSAVNAAQYAGDPLVDGETYFARVRLSNGSNWGVWTNYQFRMNSAPTPPTQSVPAAHDTLHFAMIRSVVENSSDAEGDTLIYEFEIFEDSTLFVMHSAQTASEAQPNTATGLWSDLQAFTMYWWRARSFDGWEYSEWTPGSPFLARGPGKTLVPYHQPSIVAGITASGDADTILVSPGTYYENIDFNGKSVHLLSTDGAGSTFLNPAMQSVHTILLGSTPPAECEVAGFTFTGGQAGSVISLNGGVPRIHNNVFRNFNGQGSPSMVLHVVGGAPEVFRNVFYQNQGTACIGIYGGAISIVNNTFDRNEGGILQILGSGVVRNNIVTGSETFGIYGANLDADYNCVFENYPNYQQFGGGPNDVIASPVYYDGLGGDFRLQSGSPCINAGDPDPLYNDADESRNDMGALAAVCDCGCHSDPLCDHATDMLDVIFVIGNAFRGLDELKDDFCFSHVDGSVGGRTDVNCNGYTDIVDVIRIIDVAFRGADPSSIVCASCDVP